MADLPRFSRGWEGQGKDLRTAQFHHKQISQKFLKNELDIIVIDETKKETDNRGSVFWPYAKP